MIPKQRRGLLWLMVFGLGVSACHKNPSSNRESRFQGKVKLVQSSDYSSIAIALYEAGQVDSLLQVIKSLYPSLDFKLTGRDLFDHRKRQPVARVSAQKDGTWEMMAPDGDYIAVASKEGFGWSYGYDLQPSGESVLQLWPEVHLSGTAAEAMVLLAGRHYIVDRDFTVAAGGSLMLEGGTWLRLSRSAVLNCEGHFFAVGSAGNMVRITSNTYEPYAGDWNALKLSNTEHTTLRGAVISYGGNGISLKNVRSLTINTCLFQECKYTALLLNQVQQAEIQHNVFQRNETGLYCQAGADVLISHNMFVTSAQGIESEGSQVRIENNCFRSCKTGLHARFRPGPSVRNNQFEENGAGVFCAGSNPSIRVNNFDHNVLGVEIGIEYSSYNAEPIIRFNNFFVNGNPVKLYGNAIGPNSIDVDATNNFWNTPNVADIRQMIWDKQDAGVFADVTGSVLFSPFSTTAIDSAGIVNGQ